MDAPPSQDLRRAYNEHLNPLTRNSVILGGVICLFVLPSWSLLDVLLAPDRASNFAVARLLAAGVLAVITAITAWHPLGRSHPACLALAMSVAAQAAVAWSIPLMGEHMVLRTLSYSLLIYAAAIMVVARPWWSVAVSTAAVIELAAAFAWHGVVPSMEYVVIAALFLGTAAVVATAASVLSHRSRLAAFQAHHDLVLERRLTSKLLNKLERSSREDPLTGLANRRRWEQLIESAWRSSDRVAVAVVDIDHFKRINDTFGHGAGDEVLQGLAGLLAGHEADTTTIAARLGGDEFALLARDTSDTALADRCDRIRQDVKHIRVDGHPQLRLTVSIGIAQRERWDLDGTQLMERADLNLYKAKRTRDCVWADQRPAQEVSAPAVVNG